MNVITSIPDSIPGTSGVQLSAIWRLGFGLWAVVCQSQVSDACVVAGVRAAILDHEVKVSAEDSREIS